MQDNTSNLLICVACGTQFSTSSRTDLKSCCTCDDPRQYVPRTGQSFTTLAELRNSKNYKNEFTKVEESDDRFWSVRTVPAVAINQRAILIKTPHGNVLWDCITYLDEETVTWVNDQGGIDAIVISHPHYYSTHLEWATAFNCPVYLSPEDKEWLNRTDPTTQTFLTQTTTNLTMKNHKTDIQILKLGGHFPGSLVLLAYKRLLIADTLMTTPAGVGDWSIIPSSSTSPPSPDAQIQATSSTPTTHTKNVTTGKRPRGLNSFSFMWSIPNMIPLNPNEIVKMWEVLKEVEFTSTHGAFVDMDVYDGMGGSERSVKGRVLDSMQIQVRRMGWEEHDFLNVRL